MGRNGQRTAHQQQAASEKNFARTPCLHCNILQFISALFISGGRYNPKEMPFLKPSFRLSVVFWPVVAGFALAGGACSPAPVPAVQTAVEATAQPAAAATPDTFLAATINANPITLQDYEQELVRYEAGLELLGWDPQKQGDYQKTVLEQMINGRLLVQAALDQGVNISDAALQTAYAESVAARGGDSGFADWLTLNQYTPDQFRSELRNQLLAGEVQAGIVAQVPDAVEQMHARHIVVATRAEAEALLPRLQAGEDFAVLAVEYSLDQSTKINGGDLGWFPRGFLTVPELETAVFGMQPGERSAVIETFLGFHVIEALERDPQHLLAPEAALQLRQSAVEKWLEELRAKATIERFVN